MRTITASVLSILLVIPITLHARPQTVDSLSAPGGDEGIVAQFGRFLYNNFGPVGLVLTIIMAVVLIVTLRRGSSNETTTRNGQP
ncbi:MAG: hypothetical protein GF341_05850 [candidate division Zixibacteria bacterium]|nr:hypothetical protein [candidate division Zixibacteria bacterium]